MKLNFLKKILKKISLDFGAVPLWVRNGRTDRAFGTRTDKLCPTALAQLKPENRYYRQIQNKIQNQKVVFYETDCYRYGDGPR